MAEANGFELTELANENHERSVKKRPVRVLCLLVVFVIIAALVALCIYFGITAYSNDLEEAKQNEKSGHLSDDVHFARNIRNYYLKAEKVSWNYAPTGENRVDENDGFFQDTLVNGQNRVGSEYSKYVYKQYTDATYTKQMPVPESQGFVGPLLRGEVGEIMKIHFRNEADIPFTVHAHGVRYDKDSEGTWHTDGTSGRDKADDGVPPGGSYTYIWKLDADFAPTHDDPTCTPFGYHSHKSPSKDINSGLLGLILVCKPGSLGSAGVRTDVDKEIVLYFDSIDEGKSWLLDENLERCGKVTECRELLENGDPDFEESLKKDSINGYMYGNMPGLDVCVGEKIAWYIFSLEAELHPVNIFGQTFIKQHHRSSIVGIWSATFREAEMVALNPGRWMVQCLNSEHNRNGMKVFMNVNDTCAKGAATQQLNGNVRQYYFAAEEDVWNYAPSGKNMYGGGDLTETGSTSEKYFAKTLANITMIGGTYKKSRFFEYSNSMFTSKINENANLGLLGPPIRAEVGDRIEIELLNRTPFPISIFLQGTSIEASQSGMRVKTQDGDAMTGRVVNTNMNLTYTFTVPWSVAPSDDDPQCITYLYYSAVDMERDINSGLIGPLLICKPGALDPSTGVQMNVDKELFLYFATINENLSWYIDDNIAEYTIGQTVDKEGDYFEESNKMRAINGRSYGNLEDLSTCKFDTVSWHVLSFGDTEDLHGVKFNGNNLLIDGVYTDSHVSISGLTFTGIMHALNEGTWSISCGNDFHYDAGMDALYDVKSDCPNGGKGTFQNKGITRRYYIAAVERKWNYAIKTILPLSGQNFSDPSNDQHFRVQKDGKYIGSTYTKAVYRAFTDYTFQTEIPTNDDTKHLGLVGPFIKAEVGDTVEVVFKNMATRHYSIHPQGLQYDKTNEGWKYLDNAPESTGDAVPAGEMFTYTWTVPETSGPTKDGPNCVNYMYHSAVDPVKDTYSGLAGPIVVCRRGVLDANGKRNDGVRREFALLFEAIDENQSWYLQQNIQEFSPNADTTTEDFEESNKYDSINGLIYDNIEGLVANKGEHIAWYVMALGGNEDMHTAHFHGHSFVQRTGRSHVGDVLDVFPGTYETVMMFASNPGKWLIHCHVGQHAVDGMIATYTILDP